MRGRKKREPEIRRRFAACGYTVTDYIEQTNPLIVTVLFRVPGQEKWNNRDYQIAFEGLDQIIQNTEPVHLPNFVKRVCYDTNYNALKLNEKYTSRRSAEKRLGEALVKQFCIALKPTAYDAVTRLHNVADVDFFSILMTDAWWDVHNAEQELEDSVVGVYQTED